MPFLSQWVADFPINSRASASAKEVGFDFPVYKDVNDQVADRFGVMATTDTFVIEAN
jgi:hypothetical protein